VGKPKISSLKLGTLKTRVWRKYIKPALKKRPARDLVGIGMLVEKQEKKKKN